MEHEPEEVTTDLNEGRRDFMRGVARWGLALALGAGLVALAHSEEPGCQGTCDTCPGRDSCRKPMRTEQSR